MHCVRRVYPILAVLFMFWAFCAFPAAAAEPVVTADAAVLVDAGTGQILFGKNAHQHRPPASTTKIMTGLLALEGGDLRQITTVSKHAASVGEASIELWAGEKITLEDLVYGALLESGNDACVAIAENIAGTEDIFVLLMNQKARLIGARDTNFKNTNGLPAAGHYSTAFDLATIARYALQNVQFARAVSTREKIIGREYKRHAVNTNGLLWSYPGADGVKTGTTNEAGRCLVASAVRDGRRLITVVLHSDDRFGDTTTLLDYGFKQFETRRAVEKGDALATAPVKNGARPAVQAVADGELSAVVPRGAAGLIEKKIRLDQDLTAPVAAGQRLGEVDVVIDGTDAGTVALVAAADVEPLPQHRFFSRRRS